MAPEVMINDHQLRDSGDAFTRDPIHKESSKSSQPLDFFEGEEMFGTFPVNCHAGTPYLLRDRSAPTIPSKLTGGRLVYLQNNMFHPRPGPRRDLQYHDACDIPQNLISKVQKRLIQSNQKNLQPTQSEIVNSKWIIIVVGNPMSQLLEVIL